MMIMSKIRTSVRRSFLFLRHFVLTRVYGMDIRSTAIVSFKARLDKTNPKGIHIGEKTVITTGVVILSHNYVMGDGTYIDTRIGDNVFIGVNSIIMPGVTVGNNIIVGAGSVVTKDIEDFSIVAGNPAALVRTDRSIGAFGLFDKKTK